MKKARCVLVVIPGLFVCAIAANADPSAPDAASNPYTQYDADGVPVLLTQPQGPHLSQEDIDQMHKEQARAARNKDWLLRDYEKQMQSHASAAGEDQSTNLYFELTTNKELAKLAGLSDLASDNQDSLSMYRAGASQPGQNSGPLRDDSSSRTSNSSSTGKGFRPLITPLGAPEAEGLHNFYSSSLSVVAPFYANATPSAPAPKPVVQTDDPGDIDTPGMVAAKNDPLADPAMSDLTLDVLPDESIEHARAHQDNYDTMQLPVPMSADQLHKTQETSLASPNAQNATKTPSTTPVPAAPVADPEAPTPVSKLPQINPVHAPIANPFDILDR